MAGRRPTPTKIRQLEGNPGKRPLPENEWEPAPAIPEKPAGLGAHGSRMWDDLVMELEPILARVDGMGLELICRWYQHYREAEKRRDPRASAEASKIMLRLMTEYGLSPSARTRVKSPGGKPRSALQKFLERGNRGDASPDPN